MECKFHRKLMFYIPLMYALETRFLKRSRLGVIVWTTEYLIPLLITFYLLKMNFSGLESFLLAMIAVYNFYEIGYIQNDCETIKKEQNPTLRIKELELLFYEKHKYIVYSFRIILGIIISYAFVQEQVSWFNIVLLWSVIPFYWIYNALRGRINLYLILPLTTYRYCMPFLLLGSELDHGLLWCAGLVFITYPLLKFMEVCAGGKSLPAEKWTRFFMQSYDSRFAFRIKYYGVESLFFLILQFVSKDLSWWCILPLYYFVLRISQLKLPKLKGR